MDSNESTKTQPWMAFKSTFQRPTRSPKAITYNFAKGTVMGGNNWGDDDDDDEEKKNNPGTAGEFNLSIIYDTGSTKRKA